MLVDANIFFWSVDATSPFHERADRWLTDALNGTRMVSADSDFARFTDITWINPIR